MGWAGAIGGGACHPVAWSDGLMDGLMDALLLQKLLGIDCIFLLQPDPPPPVFFPPAPPDISV